MAEQAEPPITIRHAQNLKIEYIDQAKLITVSNPWLGSADKSFQYLLLPPGAAAPPNYQKLPTFHVPVKRSIALMAIALAHIDALDLEENLIGVGSAQHVYSADIRQALEAGKIKSVHGGNTINLETVLALEPDLVISNALGMSDQDAHPRLIRNGVPVALSADYMEVTPLGRAEWIKFTAAFFNREHEAEIIFKEIESRYQAIAAQAKATKDKPTVFMNSPWGGTWHISGGKSYAAQFLRDAGAHYLWKDNPSSGGVPFDFEVVYAQALDADYWLNPGSYKSLQALIKTDARYLDFKAVETQQVFTREKRLNSSGGNDYWESGALHVDRVLADMIHIFHPELLPNHDPIYYDRLKRE